MTRTVVTSIGLISDTHFQDRSFELPQGVRALWADRIDLILHAGDVGELDILDQLGTLAPVVAVHGNDEPKYVQQVLPYQQLLTVHGLRILLWHSHYLDPSEENANRPGPWGPKLDRIARFGQAVQARIVVYGHTHVPLLMWHRDILLFNPGALASGNYFTRQVTKSVGCLQVMSDGTFEVTHFDVGTGQSTVFAPVDPDEDFQQLASQHQLWMIEPDLIPIIDLLRQLHYENNRAIIQTLMPLHKRRLMDGLISRVDLIEAIQLNPSITDKDRSNVLAILGR